MTKSKLEQLETQCSELAHAVGDLKVDVQVLREKQSAHIRHHDGIQVCLTDMKQRLHSLDNFMLSSLQRLSFLKTLFRWWPVLIVTLFVCFAVGVFVDDQKVAEEIRDNIEFKSR